MKKLTLALLALILPFLASAQNFDKYENMKEVDAVVVTSKMFKLLTKIDLNADDPETQAYIDLIENLQEMRVLSSTQDGVRKQMATDVAAYLKTGKMEELMRVSEGDKTVKFYYKPGKNDDYVSQLFMFMEGREKNKPLSVILNITGEINLAQVSKLANDFKIPGGNELKNVETKQ
ncbi:MAG: DUF4252 domain-containing protein [Salinimicrobium sediminis]|uniref:DUF4252 domain-containing protein n=1 Tax=Salinimicrobium sediminis TaxID=1343891 RepID=A0A285X7Z1_9FLAO|nr:DUF4252 domain-containing protein [Salinimicrobium sediminis]MDX1601971.1 DUF4252 domain-containing protein [Salinimicrobium sediminis]SOC81467.1 protein of unknown function [Salinimicrobium sediminis]